MSGVEEFKVKFHPIPESLTESFQATFTGYKDGMIRGDPGGLVMTADYGPNAHKIIQLKPRKDDVWIVTNPKCGT